MSLRPVAPAGEAVALSNRLDRVLRVTLPTEGVNNPKDPRTWIRKWNEGINNPKDQRSTWIRKWKKALDEKAKEPEVIEVLQSEDEDEWPKDPLTAKRDETTESEDLTMDERKQRLPPDTSRDEELARKLYNEEHGLRKTVKPQRYLTTPERARGRTWSGLVPKRHASAEADGRYER